MAKSSLTEAAYQTLRADLLTGRLPPGVRLKTAALCDAMGANLSAVREALQRLSSEGLTVGAPHRGFRAAPISTSDLIDLTRARIEIEILCLRRSIALGSVGWESTVVAAHHELSRTPRPTALTDHQRAREWWAVHERFHQAICAGCDNQWLLRIRQTLYVQSERYRLLSTSRSGEQRAHKDEHRAIFDAVIARDADRAAECIDRHISLTTDGLLQSLHRAAS